MDIFQHPLNLCFLPAKVTTDLKYGFHLKLALIQKSSDTVNTRKFHVEIKWIMQTECCIFSLTQSIIFIHLVPTLCGMQYKSGQRNKQEKVLFSKNLPLRLTFIIFDSPTISFIFLMPLSLKMTTIISLSYYIVITCHLLPPPPPTPGE